MPKIELENVTKRWGGYYGVDNLSLTIEDNEFVVFLGPSGCGKTTTLRMIAGLETPTSGRITIGDDVVFDSTRGIDVPANKRSVGFLFQNYALWPNMTIEQNISFGLSNINEVLPVIDEDAVKAAGLITALQHPKEVRDLVLSTGSKTKSLNDSRAKAKLADRFEVSFSSAKYLLGLGLHKTQDPERVADQALSSWRKVLDARFEHHRRNGESLNDVYEVIDSEGKVRKAKRKLAKEEVDRRTRQVARTVKIGEFMSRYPSELSGGQQQRVAIARTLAPEPKVLFMDEPLSNLDAKLRLETRAELQRLHLDTGSTFVYVTHDQGEAMTLATRICLLNNAELQQYEKPLELYRDPVNFFTADFVGNPPMNFIDAHGKQQEDGEFELQILEGETVRFKPREPLDVSEWFVRQKQEAKELEVQQESRWAERGAVKKENESSTFQPEPSVVNEGEGKSADREWTDQDFVLGVRPELVEITADGVFSGEVHSSMPTGLETTILLRSGNLLLTSILFGDQVHEIGERLRFNLKSDALILFSRTTGRSITLGSLKHS